MPFKTELDSALERELIVVLFKTRVRLGISGRCIATKQLGQLPLPPGEGWGEGSFIQ
jgi:hypothetical protein